MKLLVKGSFVIVLLLFVSMAMSQSLNMKIMSFNIQQPYGTNWDARKANAALIINNETPDVIGTQEAVNYQRDYLINATGYAWYGAGRDGGDAGEGSWVFYKSDKYTLDANNSGNFWMSTTPNVPSRFGGAYNRICTYVRLVEKTSGQGFYLFNAHFPTPDLYNERLQSMKMLADRMATRAVQTDPVYLTGDFNSNEQDGVTLWMKGGSDNPIKCRDTYRDVDPTGSVTTGFGTKFDYIYCPNTTNYTTSSSKVITNPAGASDHMPIVAVVNYSGVVVQPEPIAIPGKMEAEDYTSMFGIQREATEDDAGENVGFLDVGDWLKYTVTIAKTGTFKMDVRSAGLSATGKFDVYLDGVLKNTVTIAATGGWQIWETTTTSIELEEGSHELRIEVVNDGFNLNWINFSEAVTVSNEFQVKIVSANLWRKNNDWTTRKPNVVKLINSELPDVVGIQEGDEGKQAELDTDLSSYKIETGPWNDQSTAILYHDQKVKVIETGVFGFSSQPDNPAVSDWGDGAANGWLRVCNWVLFEQLSSGGRFYVYNTHLDANGFTPNAGEWRSKEVRLIAARIASRTFQEHPFVLVGDLNGVENEEAITYLKTGSDNQVKMVDTYREILPNGPGDSFGSVKYDYIMVENKSSNQVIDASIIYHSQYGWTSDHNQVVATVKFLDANTSAPKISQISQISHSPLQPTSSESVTITANVTDESLISSVLLKWGTVSGELNSSENMSATAEGYVATIPNQVDKTTIYYQIEAVNEHGVRVESQEYSFFVSDEKFGLYADYDVKDIAFTGFGGSTFAEIDNPFNTVDNPSDRVGSTVQGLETWAGIFSETLQSIDFTTTPIFKMKVYGTKVGDILVKFEDELDKEVFYDLSVPLTQVNQWTEITIDFSAAPSGVYEKLVLFFDYGTGAEDTYYFDNIRLESIVTGNSKLWTQDDIIFSPNPASNSIRFSKKCDWKIYTVSGQLALEGSSENVDITDLDLGLYLVQIENKTHRLIIK